MTATVAWPMVPLKDLVVDTQYGTSAKSNELGRGQPVIRMNNLTYEGRFDLSDVKWVELPSGESEKLGLRRGDLLFNRTNSRELVGKTGVWEGPDGFTFAGYLVRVRLRKELVLPEWVSMFMNSPQGKTALFHMAKPSINMANISATELLRLRVPVAPLEHQRRVIGQLKKAQTIRCKRMEAIVLTDELLRSTFLEMFGDPVTNSRDWKIVHFREILEVPLRNGLSPASGGAYPARVLTLAAITGDGFDESEAKDGLFAIDPWGDVRVDQRDFLICRGNGNRNLVGRGAFPKCSDAQLVFPDTMIAARVNQSVVVPVFLAVLWSSRLVRRQLEAGARTTNGTYKVNQGVVEAIRLVLPPRRKQVEFERIALHVGQVRSRQESGLMESERLVGSLVACAFSGQLGKAELYADFS